MKRMSAQRTWITSESFKAGMIGTGCGILLTISLALGFGRLVPNQSHTARTMAIGQQAASVTDHGLVPPPIDEFQRYYQSQQALRNSIGMIPPPIDEIRQLRHVVSPDEIGAGLPAPPIPGSTRY